MFDQGRNSRLKTFNNHGFVMVSLASTLPVVLAYAISWLSRPGNSAYTVQKVLRQLSEWPWNLWQPLVFGLCFSAAAAMFDTEKHSNRFNQVGMYTVMCPFMVAIIGFLVPFLVGFIPNFPINPGYIIAGIYGMGLAVFASEILQIKMSGTMITLLGVVAVGCQLAALGPSWISLLPQLFHPIAGIMMAYMYARPD